MIMVIGDVSEDVSPIEIYYGKPSEEMDKLVRSSTLFFKGAVALGNRNGRRRGPHLQRGCKPHPYYVSRIYSGRAPASGRIELRGPAPVYNDELAIAAWAVSPSTETPGLDWSRCLRTPARWTDLLHLLLS
jgi:hypothetical protein